VPCLIRVCAMTHARVRHDSLILIIVTVEGVVCVVTRLISIRAMTRSFVWHDSCICVTLLIDTNHGNSGKRSLRGNPTDFYACHDLFVCVTWLCVTWLIHSNHAVIVGGVVCVVASLIHMCAMAHSYVCHDSFMCVCHDLHAYVCDMTHACVWCDWHIPIMQW